MLTIDRHYYATTSRGRRLVCEAAVGMFGGPFDEITITGLRQARPTQHSAPNR